MCQADYFRVGAERNNHPPLRLSVVHHARIAIGSGLPGGSPEGHVGDQRRPHAGCLVEHRVGAVGRLHELRLADRRNEALRNYIKATQPVTVESYNMAEQSSAFEKIFKTTDSKLKNSFISAGLPTTADDPQYPSKASHAVIV